MTPRQTITGQVLDALIYPRITADQWLESLSVSANHDGAVALDTRLVLAGDSDFLVDGIPERCRDWLRGIASGDDYRRFFAEELLGRIAQMDKAI